MIGAAQSHQHLSEGCDVKQDIYSYVDECLKPLSLIDTRALLLKAQQGFYLLPLSVLADYKNRAILNRFENDVLLIPLALTVNDEQYHNWQKLCAQLEMIGFEIVEKRLGKVIKLVVNKVPRLVRSHNIQQLIFEILNQKSLKVRDFILYKIPQVIAPTLSSAIADLTVVEAEQRLMQEMKADFIEVDFNYFLDREEL